MKYTVGSLFAGVGGVCLGFKRSSNLFKMTFANEMDSEACKTYAANFDHNLIPGDIEKILDPQIVLNEREWLLNRKKELISAEVDQLNFNEKLVKEAVKKSNSPFFIGIAMSGNFDFSDPLKKKLNKLDIDIDKFREYIEYQNILLNLEVLTEEKTRGLYESFTMKNREITSEKIDVLTAGFPCQAFSIAGDRKGFNDHRGELFYSVLNLAEQLEKSGHGKPRVLFLENVKNLLVHDEGRTFDRIQREIKNFGYTISEPLVMNTYKYTQLPQNRERIFVVCFRDEKDAQAFGSLRDIPMINREKHELEEALRNTLDYDLTREAAPKYYYTREKYPQYFMTEEERIEQGKDDKINLIEDIDEMYEIYQVRRGMYVRKNQSGVCPTLTANMGTGGHNVPLIKTHDGIRKLTPKDCFNLQGFRVGTDYILPAKVSDASLYKQSGNAVSVDIIDLIAKKILGAFLTVDGLENQQVQSEAVLEENLSVDENSEINESNVNVSLEENFEEKSDDMIFLEKAIEKIEEISMSDSLDNKVRDLIRELEKKCMEVL